MVVKIPKLYRTKIIEIETEDEPIEIEIRGYRPADIEYAANLQNLRNQLPSLFNKLKIFRDLQNKIIDESKKHTPDTPMTPEELESSFVDNMLQIKDNDYTEEELRELEESKVEVDRIQKEIEINASLLGQRGLKRYFYKDDPEYQQAENENRATEHIDKIPDIEIDQDNLTRVAYAMIELSAPNNKLNKRLERKIKKKAAGKGK